MNQVRLHFILMIAWGLQAIGAVYCLIIAIRDDIDPVKFFLLSVGYISLCSIYANFINHWTAWLAAQAKRSADETRESAS
jgi:hypothetical protein